MSSEVFPIFERHRRSIHRCIWVIIRMLWTGTSLLWSNLIGISLIILRNSHWLFLWQLLFTLFFFLQLSNRAYIIIWETIILIFSYLIFLNPMIIILVIITGIWLLLWWILWLILILLINVISLFSRRRRHLSIFCIF